MQYTGFEFDNKPLASLSIGCMRFPSREAAAEVVAACVPQGVLYLDTAPMYCYRSEEENAETWVGAAIKGMRERVILSAKCAVGGGGSEVGTYDPVKGFSITTADQVRRQIDRTLRRMGEDRLDCYHLWAVHAPNLFDEALKPGGWMAGALQAKEEGLFRHLGITGHCDGPEVTRWIDSGYFDLVTIPFHLLDRSRLAAAQYAREKGVAVLAMNPLAGGLLGSVSPVLTRELGHLGVDSATSLALKYCASFPGVSALCGMTAAAQVAENVAAVRTPPWDAAQRAEVEACFEQLMSRADHLCTACGYCMPCPQHLNIPEILKLRNYYRILQLDTAIRMFEERYKYWGDSHRVDRCSGCGACEQRCPNSLPISRLLASTMEELGANLLQPTEE